MPTYRHTLDADLSSSYSYAYDDLYQLTSDSRHTYCYDSLCNRVTKDQTFYTVNDLNQLTHQNDQNYTYDPDGNLLQDNERLFSYDALGRLTEIKKGEDATQYSYDGFHRRMNKIHKGEETNFLYQRDNEIGAYKDNKLIQFRVLGLTRGLEIGASIALELNDKVYTPIHDAFGNIVTLVHHLQPVETYRYTAFGETDSLPSLRNPWRFSSKRLDEESGLYYFGRRYYQPDIGRWISPDPAGFADGFNLYNYVNNNPLRYIDPDGRLPFLIVPITLYALEFSLPYLLTLVTGYTGSAFLVALVAATVQVIPIYQILLRIPLIILF